MKTKRIISIVGIMLIAVTLSSTMKNVYAANNNIKIKEYNTPTSITMGKDYIVKGKITSNRKIKRVEIGVTTKGGGKWTAQKYDKKNVNAKSFDIGKANKRLRFNKLKTGSYYYRIYVHTTDNKVVTVVNKKFTVKGNTTSPPYTTGCNYPHRLSQGLAYSIKGTVKSKQKMSQVTVGVVNKNSGKWTFQKKTSYVDNKSFNILNADKYIKFGSLAKGDYYYRITAKVGNKTYTVLNKEFTITAPAQTESDGSTKLAGNTVQLNNYTLPSKYKVGKNVKLAGTISSAEKINKVEIGIVYASTNKWTSHKYEKTGVNSKYFDITKAASKLDLSTLAGGTYRYRIYVHTASGVRLVMNHKFEVIPSDKPKAAISWALKIAADDTFTYGKKPQTSKVGCYFCGTNAKRKPKGYERTYVCMTFVHAAYAHGAKDPEMLKECQKGNNCIALEETNMTHYSCWMKVGLCKDLKVDDLLPGDLIVWYAADNNHGHISMYIGNNNIVDATSGAGDVWGPNSIAVRNGKAESYLKTGARWHSKSYVIRYCKP